jgi:methylglutaconyl-CoA hydratase
VADSANFSFPELRLGLMPAVISPYVCAAIGQRATRALFLTSERFDAVAALRLGLVHRTCADEHLESEGSDLVMTLLNQGPAALGQLKLFLQHVASHPIDQPLAVWTARHLARLRSSTEAQEGMLAAIERRKPRWST